MNSSEEKYIIQEVLNGNVQPYSKLVHAYKNYAFTLALRVVKDKNDAEEIAQDSFVKAYQQLDTFKGESKFSTWLYTIVYRNAISMMRKKKLNVADVDERILNNFEDHSSFSMSNLSKDEEQQYYIKKALEKLSEQDAALITLFYFEEHSIEEIEKIIGLSKSNVKVKLHRIRKKLYQELSVLLKEEIKSIL